jgi:Helitron helicase-like domain at N-terminus
VPCSNPQIQDLKKIVTASRRNVVGTDESRSAIQSKIYGLTLRKNPATLWITLNFADPNDPIVQILAGEEIDMDHFIATAGPDQTQRGINAASDPFAAAKYFHMSVKMVLQEIYGISVNQYHHIYRQVGIFGRVSANVGTVEAQGRGSLHLHLLLWLVGSPTTENVKYSVWAGDRKTNRHRQSFWIFWKKKLEKDEGVPV